MEAELSASAVDSRSCVCSAPPQSSSLRRSSDCIEQFKFRNAEDSFHNSKMNASNPPPSPAPVPAFSRLYAQGVDLLEHKDSIFRQFGLRKSITKEGASGSASSRISFATTTTGAKATATPTLQRTTTSRKIVQAPAAQSRVQMQTRHPKQTQSGREQRSSSTPYLSDCRVLPAGTAAAPTFSFRSTMESRSLVSPKPKFLSRKKASAPCSASMKQNASSFGHSSHRQSNNTRSSGGNPRPSHGSTRHEGGISAKRLMNSGTTSSSMSGPGYIQIQHHATTSGRTVNKRASFQVSQTGHQQTHQQQHQQQHLKAGGSRRDSMAQRTTVTNPSKRPSVCMGVLTMSCGENPPVLIQVSRRTSSPIMTPSVAEFGMRKRPSVSPIPTLAESGQPFQAPQPRPSILMRQNSKMDKLVEQITVLKASLGLSDEDLQWKVESTKGNAFLAAERHLHEGEERYDRLEYEVQLLSQTPCEEVSSSLVKQVRALMYQSHAVSGSKPKLLACQNDIARLKKELLDAKIAAELHLAKSSPAATGNAESNVLLGETNPLQVTVDTTQQVLQQLEDAKAHVLQIQEQLKDDISKLNDMLLALGSETDRLAKTCAEFKFMSPEVADVSNQLIATLKRIPECSGEKLLSLCEQTVATAQKLRGSRLRDLKKKEMDFAKTMKDIEIWKSRRDQAKEFPIELAKREQQWKVDNLEDNTKSLKLLRSLVPQDVQQINVDTIIERAQSRGVLYTFDLAIYLKQNRFLHWLVTHESDVARDNFLAIECASFFFNFVAYDIHELRAFAAILPASGFDFDKDGKKADWKLQFMDHVYALVKQQKGEKVKAGWDPIRRARGEVQLKPLSDKQLLNAVYRYPSEQEIQARIDKFELQRKRMGLKKDKLRNLEDELIPAAKAEYLAIAEDARSEELQRSFGKATLIRMRDDAKQSFQTLCRSRDVLKSEIDHSEKQWKALCPTYEQFLDEVEKIRKLDPQTRQERIRGPFPEEIELKPRERAAFKKLSVEEEAQARKTELDHAIASRGKEISDAAAIEPQVVAAEGATGSSVLAEEGAATGTPEGDASGTTIGATGTASSDNTQKDSSTLQNPQSRGSFRRIKSLQVSNEVLKFLQQDFCNANRVNKLAPPALKTPGAATLQAVTAAVKIKRFASEQCIDLRSLSENDETAKVKGEPLSARKPAASAAPARPKSKALLQLLEKEKQSALNSVGGHSQEDGDTGSDAVRPPAPSMKMNMFSELQNRFKKKTSNLEDVVETEAPAKKPGAAMSFLDELKNKATRNKTPVDSELASPPPQRESDVVIPSGSVVALPPPAPSAPKSFLDELRARSRSVN